MGGSWFRTFKPFLMGLLLVTAYSSFILDIIMIIKVRHYSNTYPPAVVALLVCSLLEALYCLWLLVKSGRGSAFRASAVEGALAFFACFSFACIVATTVLRHHRQYCNTDLEDNSDLCGVLRGVMGLGWMLFGLNLIWLCILPVLASGQGTWAHYYGDLPYEDRGIEEEKAPVH
ncbi:hypothetical protein J008_05780 [Cryptococcus neoformans]|uniref:MARVEL domain-containing protein n=2 Tax=Cryptococcus neoformans TaxID=5207 RepID=A0A854Q6W5_CRYNE|nr:hypothetical protein CNAG_01621 [Cryptococcus neoformans var. grubii H99]OWT36318.1 hypothetical protein C362_06015 [Cryptococcus neoformans var. grubii Bt1]OWZ27590.1 hypothetical protein C347_06016 [Cryptococcus neoformans var. grubii AD2-60a]OWZ32705.1 hypothetical protein C353_05877 [Cryptococcus neoformans var. grubii AD1-83a]OWZ39894.1 hypothetical protein C343_05977 [Cryptococcus neoformans var. grubii C23]OWZ50973.1 hypothetical protein C368_06131 [Cryptococcus neoformans var. grubi|eukprot:XP_012052646.1 hypothetical protein CNAG_01621 [Cryptococcus neoformans var. grubii H99]